MNSYIYVFLKKDALKSKDFKLERGSSFKGDICGVKVSRKDYGELYFMVDGFDSKLPDGVEQYVDRTEATCIFAKGRVKRERGIYSSRGSNIIAELDESSVEENNYVLRLKGEGYCPKGMDPICKAVRTGNIKPDPRDSYEKEQCKEDMRLSSVLIRKLENIFFKRYFFPGGFGREVVKIVKEAKSSLAT
ncbi:MAG: hypothetical protein AAB688_01015 [Patescibacteria group bacterium]